MGLPEVPISAVFDIETKEIGNPYEIEASAMVVIRSDQPKRLLYFTEDEIREGAEWLLASPHITSFNGRQFDVPVLLKYMSRGEGRKLRAMPHYDIFDEWVKWNRGGRISLNNMATYSLGISKFENLTAGPIEMYEQGLSELLFQYNYWDTYLTYMLLLQTLEKGYLTFKLPVIRKFYPEMITRTD